jgi:hypothetical protein
LATLLTWQAEGFCYLLKMYTVTPSRVQVASGTEILEIASERKKRVAPEGEGASYLAGGGWSVHATRAKYAPRLPHDF